MEMVKQPLNQTLERNVKELEMSRPERELAAEGDANRKMRRRAEKLGRTIKPKVVG